jgi:hypothetical protein
MSSNEINVENLVKSNEDLLKNKVILDIGSNIGLFSKKIIQNIPYKQIHLFEPVTKYFNQSKENLKNYKNLFFYNFALGSENEKKDIYINKIKEEQDTGWNTLLTLDPNQSSNFYENMDKEVVVIKRLDECLKDIDQIDFIKIDVEGFEAEALEGSFELIKKFKPYILIEVGWGTRHPNWNKNIEVYKKLFEIGYKEQDLNFSETRDVLFEPEYRKLPISVGVLSWNSKYSLKNSLESYKKNKLFEICDDFTIFIQEANNAKILKENNISYLFSNNNLGIGKAFELLATNARNEYVMLLEHDWELIENFQVVYERLLQGIEKLNNGFDCIRYRHRKDYGDPLYSRNVYEGKELDFFDSVTKLKSPHLLDSIHWIDNPEEKFPDKIIKINNYYCADSRWANWTNNPCLYKKEFYLNCIKNFTGKGIELEEKISKWWAESNFKVCQGEGLFKHNDLDKYKKYNIVDIFPYFNEEELLNLRIKLLDPVVDKFIICEANRTHSGVEKEFNCKKTLEKLGLLSDKINVLEIDFSEIKDKNQTWNRERLQRDYASSFIEEDDICLVSDCDEIIDPNLVKYYASVAYQNDECILRIPLVLLSGRADLQVYDENEQPILCTSPYFCNKKHTEFYSLSDIRESSNGINKQKLKFNDIFILEDSVVKFAGWHFTWMGDNNRRLNKYKSFMHYYDKILNSILDNQQEIENFIINYEPKENLTDSLGRNNHILKKYQLELLPKEIFKLEKIKNFLLPS